MTPLEILSQDPHVDIWSVDQFGDKRIRMFESLPDIKGYSVASGDRHLWMKANGEDRGVDIPLEAGRKIAALAAERVVSIVKEHPWAQDMNLRPATAAQAWDLLNRATAMRGYFRKEGDAALACAYAALAAFVVPSEHSNPWQDINRALEAAREATRWNIDESTAQVDDIRKAVVFI